MEADEAEDARRLGAILPAHQGFVGAYEVKGIEPKNVLTLRDLYASTPASANNLLRCLSSMLAWSVPRGWRPDNPCREIKPLKGAMAMLRGPGTQLRKPVRRSERIYGGLLA